MQITKDEFTIWRAMPETQDAFRRITRHIEELGAELSRGATVSADSMNATALNTALVVGEVAGLESLILMEHEEE